LNQQTSIQIIFNVGELKKAAGTASSQENISDFVAKKREMFLVQMSLDVKKAEILKLDARAKDKEEAGASDLM
jgi:hypothetical protein